MSTANASSSSPSQLDDVLISTELKRRPARPPDFEAESRALVALASHMAASPQTILQKLVDTTLELCRADSAGISILEPDEGPGVFRWHAIAGAFARNLGNTMARSFSPCSTVLDRDSTLLFDRPARHFTELATAEPQIFENLLVPFHYYGRPVGTVWAIAHTSERKFDAEDARLLKGLSRFAAAAYQLTTALRTEKEARDGLEQQAQERTLSLTEANQALRDSEERYRALFESIDEGFCIIEMLFDEHGKPTDYRFLETNPAFEKHTGIHHALGKRMRDIASKHEEHWFEIYGRVALTGEPVRFVNEAKALDGRWFDVNASRVGGQKSRNVAILFSNITARKRAEEALRGSEERLRAIYDGTYEYIGLLAPDGTLLEANRASLEFAGNTREEVIGRPFWETPWFTHTPGAPETMRQAVTRAAAGEFVRYEAPVRRPSGELVTFDVSLHPIRNAHGEVLLIVPEGRDITDRKRIEAALRVSEERLRVLIESVQDYAIFTLDSSGRVTSWNEGAHRLKGYTAEEIIGQPLARFYTDDDVAAGKPAHEMEVALTRGRSEDESWRVRKDGTLFWVNEIMTPLNADDGTLLGFTKISRDLTERKQAEVRSRESEERFRAIVNQATAGVAETDLNGKFTLVNHRFCELTGYTQAELLKRGFKDITHLDDLARCQEVFERAVATCQPFINEKRYRRKDGSEVWISDSVSVICGKDGDASKVVTVAIEITERKQTEAALRNADRRKDEFLATLAHELRNPLAPLKSALEILRIKEGNHESTYRMREIMAYQINHLAHLVDDLLEVSRITCGKIELRKERVDFKDIMQKAVETSRPLVDAAGHELSVTVPYRSLYLEGDSVRLTQVIANLLNNAVKYTKGSGRLELCAASEDNEVVVWVRDNGIGIVSQMLPRIFDLFTQADASSTRAHDGLGLGLTLVKHIVELHGGHVEAKSQGLGHGSEFIVRLPLTAAGASAAYAAQPTAIEAPASPHRILVVDDNSAAADTLGEVLESYGNDVQVVHDGQTALKVCGSYRPNVILLDIGMPGMDGYEVARRVRQQSQADGITLIAVTGWGQESDRHWSHEAGIDHHLTKPLDLAKLRALLASVS